METVKITVFVSSYAGVRLVIRHRGAGVIKTFQSEQAAQRWAGSRGSHLTSRICGERKIMTGTAYLYVLKHKGDLQ